MPIKEIRGTGSRDKRHRSGRPRAEENMDLIEELVCLQEEWPHTHLAPRKLSEQTEISRSSLWSLHK